MKQITLNAPFSVKGKGLHTGMVIEAEFLPAPDNHGYKFQRTDLEGEPVIDALAENVIHTERGTVIARGEVSVSTIEHAMAALYAAGIDNVLIRINGAEMPILDGSAREISEKIQSVGVVSQNENKDYYIVKQKLEVRDDATGASILVLPDDDFSIDVKIQFDSPVIPNQFASLDVIDNFDKDIASSRTFVFVREIEPLVKANLIKGGDLENAVVIYDQTMEQPQLDKLADMMNVPHKEVDEFGYIQATPLRWANEPARHKLMDVMGDLALIGRPLKGKVIATRPGHTINTKFAKKIRKEIKRQDVQAPVYDPNKQPIMTTTASVSSFPTAIPSSSLTKSSNVATTTSSA